MGFFIYNPCYTYAHEVYVLSQNQITQAVDTSSFNMVAVAEHDAGQFILWAFISALVVFCVFFISIIRVVEKYLDPWLAWLRPWAPLIGRVTIGLSFLAAAYYQASYGPELPLVATYGSLAGFVTVILIAIGVMMIIGLYTRLAASIAIVMFAIGIYFHGWYMLTYTNYLGEAILLLFLGAHNWSIDQQLAAAHGAVRKGSTALKKFKAWFAPKSFAIMRVC